MGDAARSSGLPGRDWPGISWSVEHGHRRADAGVALRLRKQKAGIETEEATKNAFVMPFISTVLGYDVFNPAEVIPEFTADVGLKKGEKIDYVISR